MQLGPRLTQPLTSSEVCPATSRLKMSTGWNAPTPSSGAGAVAAEAGVAASNTAAIAAKAAKRRTGRQPRTVAPVPAALIRAVCSCAGTRAGLQAAAEAGFR